MRLFGKKKKEDSVNNQNDSSNDKLTGPTNRNEFALINDQMQMKISELTKELEESRTNEEKIKKQFQTMWNEQREKFKSLENKLENSENERKIQSDKINELVLELDELKIHEENNKLLKKKIEIIDIEKEELISLKKTLSEELIKSKKTNELLQTKFEGYKGELAPLMRLVNEFVNNLSNNFQENLAEYVDLNRIRDINELQNETLTKINGIILKTDINSFSDSWEEITTLITNWKKEIQLKEEKKKLLMDIRSLDGLKVDDVSVSDEDLEKLEKSLKRETDLLSVLSDDKDNFLDEKSKKLKKSVPKKSVKKGNKK